MRLANTKSIQVEKIQWHRDIVKMCNGGCINKRICGAITFVMPGFA